jgi:hypothetical protein
VDVKIKFNPMKKKNRAMTPKKKPGRPVTIAAENFVGVKLPTALLEEIDAYASAHKVSRSESIRALVEAGLKSGRRRD